jgi:hypothetical protein
MGQEEKEKWGYSMGIPPPPYQPSVGASTSMALVPSPYARQTNSVPMNPIQYPSPLNFPPASPAYPPMPPPPPQMTPNANYAGGLIPPINPLFQMPLSGPRSPPPPPINPSAIDYINSTFGNIARSPPPPPTHPSAVNYAASAFGGSEIPAAPNVGGYNPQYGPSQSLALLPPSQIQPIQIVPAVRLPSFIPLFPPVAQIDVFHWNMHRSAGPNPQVILRAIEMIVSIIGIIIFFHFVRIFFWSGRYYYPSDYY